MRYSRVLESVQEKITITRLDRLTVAQTDPDYNTIEQDLEIIISERRENVNVGDTFITTDLFYGIITPYNSKIRVGDFVLRGTSEERSNRDNELTIINIESRPSLDLTRIIMENKDKVGSGRTF